MRGKHQLTVLIAAQAQGYTLRYVSSLNLLYREQDRTGQPLRAIHHNYNTWVRELAAGVNAALGARGAISVVVSSRGGTGKAASASAAPYPDNAAITPPAADAPAQAKVLSGVWQGKWGGDLDHILVVERIEGHTVHYVYSYGTSRGIRQAGFRRGSGTLDDAGVLRIVTSNGTKISYEPSKDGQSLNGAYQQGGRVTLGVFGRRAPPGN